MKITYEGFYGFQNSGDDAFIEVCAWGARKYWNCENNRFIGKFLPDTLYPIAKDSIFPKTKGFDRLNLLPHLFNSDYFISAGGSTFPALPSYSNKAIAYHFNKLNKKLGLGAIGVSLGPFKNSKTEQDVIGYLKTLQFLGLRDNRSYEFAKSLNLPYKPINAFDLAALLPLVYEGRVSKPEKDTGESKTIGISICNYESFTNGDIAKEKKRNTFFRELVELLAKETSVNFRVFIINGNKKRREREVSEELMKNIDKNRISFVPYSSSVHEVWNKIANCDLMISTRLHASIFACYAQVPFFLIEYHQKCTDFLIDVGQDDKYRLYDAGVSAKSALEKIRNVLQEGYNPPANILKTIKKSEKNFTLTLRP